MTNSGNISAYKTRLPKHIKPKLNSTYQFIEQKMTQKIMAGKDFHDATYNYIECLKSYKNFDENTIKTIGCRILNKFVKEHKIESLPKESMFERFFESVKTFEK